MEARWRSGTFPGNLIDEVQGPGRGGAPSRFLRVQGLDDLIHRSFEEGALFSELGVDWARPTPAFHLDDYRSFPSRPMPIQSPAMGKGTP